MKKKNDNVIMFPTRGNPPPPSKEQNDFDVSMVKIHHVNEALNTIIPMLFNNITIAGFDIVPDDDEDDENLKDSALIVESVRSILYKHYDIKHPLQEVAENFFIHKETGILTVTKHLELDLDNYDKEPADEAE